MQPYYKNKIKHKTSNKVCYKIGFFSKFEYNSKKFKLYF